MTKAKAEITGVLYACFKDGKFVDAAVCDDRGGIDLADQYIRNQERRWGVDGFTYLYGARAKKNLPKGYVARAFHPSEKPKKLDRELAHYLKQVSRPSWGL